MRKGRALVPVVQVRLRRGREISESEDPSEHCVFCGRRKEAAKVSPFCQKQLEALKELLTGDEGKGGVFLKEKKGACVDCLGKAKKLWDLREQEKSIQAEIAEVLKGLKKVFGKLQEGASTPIKIKEEGGSSMKRSSRQRDAPIVTRKMKNEELVDAVDCNDLLEDFIIHPDKRDGPSDGATLGKEEKTEVQGSSLIGMSPSPSTSGRPQRLSKLKAQNAWKGIPSCPDSEVSREEDITLEEQETLDLSEDDNEEEECVMASSEGEGGSGSEQEEEQSKKSSRKRRSDTTSTRKKKSRKLADIEPDEDADTNNRRYPCSKCGEVFTRHRSKVCHELFTCKVPYKEDELIRLGVVFPKCDICGELCRDMTNLRMHMTTHTGRQPFNCGQCDAGFPRKDNLLSHQKETGHKDIVVEDVEAKKCPHCSRQFFCNNRLEVHLTRVHNKKKSPRPKPKYTICHQCGKSVKQMRLKQHIREVHEKVVKATCEDCGKTFRWMKHYRTHVAKHHPSSPGAPLISKENIICPHCPGKTFESKHAFRQHNRGVHGPKRHACDVCGYRFFAKSDLRKHLRTHEQTKLRCDDCSRTFKTKEDLAEHQSDESNCRKKYRVQPRPRPMVQCSFCIEWFEGIVKLRAHVNLNHPDAKYAPRDTSTFVAGIVDRSSSKTSSARKRRRKSEEDSDSSSVDENSSGSDNSDFDQAAEVACVTLESVRTYAS